MRRVLFLVGALGLGVGCLCRSPQCAGGCEKRNYRHQQQSLKARPLSNRKQRVLQRIERVSVALGCGICQRAEPASAASLTIDRVSILSNGVGSNLIVSEQVGPSSPSAVFLSWKEACPAFRELPLDSLRVVEAKSLSASILTQLPEGSGVPHEQHENIGIFLDSIFGG